MSRVFNQAEIDLINADKARIDNIITELNNEIETELRNNNNNNNALIEDLNKQLDNATKQLDECNAFLRQLFSG